MVLKNLIPYLLLLLLFKLPLSGFGQQKLNCGGVKLTVPKFPEGTLTATQNIFVKTGILKPINQSDAALELRFYYDNMLNDKMFVIKCSNDSIRAERYTLHTTGSEINPALKGTTYKNLGYIDSLHSNFIYKKASYMLPPTITWQTFLDSLIVENHLFELPDQATLDRNNELKIVAYNGKSNYGLIRYEISVNGHFRSFEQYKVYAYGGDTVIPAISYYKNIHKLLQKLIAPSKEIN